MTQWTIRSLMEWTERHFEQKGIESPRLEAQLLLAHALGCRRVDLYTRWDESVDDSCRTRFRELIQRRLQGCPVMYLTGRREFFTLEFEVTPVVLIPRPETEVLVAEALRSIKDVPVPRVLDIGTGSGCIAIVIAHRNKQAQLVATDICVKALEVATRNAQRHHVADRIRFLHGDMFTPLEPELQFDTIVSNPPYIAHSEFAELAVHVRDYEPRLALDGGLTGFDAYDRLIPGAAAHLAPGGWLILEIGAAQEAGVRARLSAAGDYVFNRTVVDANGLPRVVVARKEA